MCTLTFLSSITWRNFTKNSKNSRNSRIFRRIYENEFNLKNYMKIIQKIYFRIIFGIFLEKPVFPIAESSVLLNHISVVAVSSSIDQRLRKRTKYSKVWKIANFLAKMSLYPSLEDMQVDQMVKVSTYSIIRSPDPLFF